MGSTWLVVANSSMARFFQVGKNGSLLEIETLIHPESRLHGKDLTSDRPGRAYESSSSTRHAIEPSTFPKEVEAEVFARAVAAHLYAAFSERRFNRLQIVAAPHFLGLLRQAIASNIAQTIFNEINKDVTQFTVEEIKKLLAQ
ncbi:MAG: host attachment protein [Parachlamydiaceae bacterium]